MQQELLIVAKRPAAGSTKTRLCPPLTAEMAALVYQAFLHDALDLMRQTQVTRRTIAFWPDDALAYFRELAPDMQHTLQQGEDLGQRLNVLLTTALQNGADHAVVMSSDCPNLPQVALRDAFRALADGADLVLGPSEDGGYYLIGLKTPQPRLLTEVQMSTPTVLQETLQIAHELSLQVAFTRPWYDVDTIEELQRLATDLRMASPTIAPHSRAMLNQLEDGIL
jgi:uncharacterized protein